MPQEYLESQEDKFSESSSLSFCYLMEVLEWCDRLCCVYILQTDWIPGKELKLSHANRTLCKQTEIFTV